MCFWNKPKALKDKSVNMVKQAENLKRKDEGWRMKDEGWRMNFMLFEGVVLQLKITWLNF